MDPKLVQAICTEIYRRFPEVSGAQPKVRLLSSLSASAGTSIARPNSRLYLITFHARVAGPSGKSIPRWVRVTSNAQGQIVKVSTSH